MERQAGGIADVNVFCECSLLCLDLAMARSLPLERPELLNIESLIPAYIYEDFDSAFKF